MNNLKIDFPRPTQVDTVHAIHPHWPACHGSGCLPSFVVILWIVWSEYILHQSGNSNLVIYYLSGWSGTQKNLSFRYASPAPLHSVC